MPSAQARRFPPLAVLLVLAASNGRAAETPPSGRAIYEQTCRSTAWVLSYPEHGPRKTGTGFLVDRAHKWLVTNYHVVDQVGDGPVGVVFPLYDAGETVAARKHYLRYDRPVRGWVVAADPRRDLAVIELDVVPHAVAALRLAADSCWPGDPVYLVGNPGLSQLLWVYNAGTVHQVSFRTLHDFPSGRVKQALLVEVLTRSPVLPGYSGGPLVNARGELAGVTTLAARNGTRAWSVDVSAVRDVLEMLREYPKGARRMLDPRSPADRQAQQAYYRTHGRPDHAVASYTEALRLDAKDAQAYVGRGAAYARQGVFDKAIADFTRAVQLDPKNGQAFYNRGLAHAQQGADDKALADFARALRLDPENVLAYLDRGAAHSRQGAHDQALADFTAALRLDPENLLAHLERARAYLRQGSPDRAVADFREALRINPKDAATAGTLARLLATCPDAKVRDGSQAVAYATRACELTAWRHPALLDTLAAAYAESGRFAEAVTWQKRALEQAREPEAARFRSRLSLYEAGKPYREKALEESD